MANDRSMVSVKFNETSLNTESRSVWQYDHGLTLQVYGLESVSVEQIHFSNSDTGKALNILSTQESDGGISAPIPDVLQAQDKDIYAYLYIEDDTSGYTARTVKIPMNPRAKPETISFESPSMGAVSQLAQELEALIDEVESLKKGTSDAATAANSAASKANTAASSANTATTNANKATESANTAATNAQDAADKLNNISFGVNPKDGCLYMYIGAIAIITQPVDITTPTNSTITFSTTAFGDNLTYQWEYTTNGGATWANNSLTGNATDTLTFTAKAYHDGYKYRCLITDANGNTLRTNEVTLTIDEAVGSTE